MLNLSEYQQAVLKEAILKESRSENAWMYVKQEALINLCQQLGFDDTAELIASENMSEMIYNDTKTN